MADNNDAIWSCDVRISMPLPSKAEPGVLMQGFAFTENGLGHDLTEERFARISTPTFRPARVPTNEVYDDLDVEDLPFTSEETF